jgi:hypothetical protein
MSSVMKTMRDTFFEKSKKTSMLDSHDLFRTYCELHDGECIFLVHVPELRRFTSHAKELLGKAAWSTAQSLLKESGAGKPGMRVAVGLRGIAAYDRVLMGDYLPDYKAVGAAQEPGLTTNSGISPESDLYSWFVTSPATNASAR